MGARARPVLTRERRWLPAVALPCSTLPLLIAAFGARLATVTVVWLLVAITMWPTYYESRRAKRARAAAASATT
ncbi:hypothetical protein ACFYRN_20190 [Streptomyces sp. NPDC005227]|uniref:hypothetical protein n=1 Tax=Streptomyces sp. NPDC005227 TaxID=3364707 RepID=UPI0036C48C99